MYMGGGKTKPMYMYGGKVYKDGGSMMSALLKDPKQRAAAKKMLGSMENGGMMKYEKGGVMNATGETGSKRSTRSSATKSAKNPYRRREAINRQEEDLFKKEMKEEGVYLPKQGQLTKELNSGYPIIPSKDESGRTVPFKEGYVRSGYTSSDTKKNQKLGIKPIGQNLSK